MNCNLKERALMLFKNKKNKKECIIRTAFNKKFKCNLDVKDITLKYGIVCFEFDGFEIWGNTTSDGEPYFNFHTDRHLIYSEINTIEDLGYFIDVYVENK